MGGGVKYIQIIIGGIPRIIGKFQKFQKNYRKGMRKERKE